MEHQVTKCASSAAENNTPAFASFLVSGSDEMCSPVSPCGQALSRLPSLKMDIPDHNWRELHGWRLTVGSVVVVVVVVVVVMMIMVMMKVHEAKGSGSGCSDCADASGWSPTPRHHHYHDCSRRLCRRRWWQTFMTLDHMFYSRWARLAGVFMFLVTVISCLAYVIGTVPSLE
jgi:hypothetical protein